MYWQGSVFWIFSSKFWVYYKHLHASFPIFHTHTHTQILTLLIINRHVHTVTDACTHTRESDTNPEVSLYTFYSQPCNIYSHNQNDWNQVCQHFHTFSCLQWTNQTKAIVKVCPLFYFICPFLFCSKEISRLASQIRRLYGSNRKAMQPFHLFLTDMKEDSLLYKECIRMNEGFLNYLVSMDLMDLEEELDKIQ